MIALAERLDREGRESLIAGPRIMWRLPNHAWPRCHGYGHSIENFLADTARATMPAARGAPTAR
jgi:hypothetical protein